MKQKIMILMLYMYVLIFCPTPYKIFANTSTYQHIRGWRILGETSKMLSYCCNCNMTWNSLNNISIQSLISGYIPFLHPCMLVRWRAFTNTTTSCNWNAVFISTLVLVSVFLFLVQLALKHEYCACRYYKSSYTVQPFFPQFSFQEIKWTGIF